MRLSTGVLWGTVSGMLLWGLSGGAVATSAQDGSRGYDPIAAGQDAYNYHEQMRLDNIDRQLGLIEQMKWYYPRGIFSPWPYVPGDIYGYQWYVPVPQSIGQRQIQTGPNRWESHPVYAAPPGVASFKPPLPDVRERPVREVPAIETPRRRPREF